jgi:hypothetical protein
VECAPCETRPADFVETWTQTGALLSVLASIDDATRRVCIVADSFAIVGNATGRSDAE